MQLGSRLGLLWGAPWGLPALADTSLLQRQRVRNPFLGILLLAPLVWGVRLNHEI